MLRRQTFGHDENKRTQGPDGGMTRSGGSRVNWPAIARRVSAGKHVLRRFRRETATVDASSRASVEALIQNATYTGDVAGLIHAAGVSLPPWSSDIRKKKTKTTQARKPVLLHLCLFAGRDDS